MRYPVFTTAVVVSLALGVYSLVLAAVNAGEVRQTNTAGLVRTAASGDSRRIGTALGTLADADLVFVILDRSAAAAETEIEIAAVRAAGVLGRGKLNTSVRRLSPADDDFTTIASQNGVDRFPTVLAVRKGGGIVRVTDEVSEQSLLRAYRKTWGRTSSCDEARSAVY